jgi:hypothetical protein
MIINAEIFQLEEDYDNNLWLIDFRDEEKNLRGKIEIPSKIVKMQKTKKIQIEVKPLGKRKQSFKDCLIVYNATSFRTKPTGEEKIYSFSAGGLIFRIFSGKAIPEFKTPLKEYQIIVRQVS